MRTELHKSHVGRLREFGDDARRGEHLEHGLHGHDRVTVGQVVLLRRVGRLLVHHHYCVRQVYRRLDQVVQTSREAEKEKLVGRMRVSRPSRTHLSMAPCIQYTRGNHEMASINAALGCFSNSRIIGLSVSGP